MLRKYEPGETVSVTVYRAGKEVQLRVILDEKPREEQKPQTQIPEQPYPAPNEDSIEKWFRDFMDDFYG